MRTYDTKFGRLPARFTNPAHAALYLRLRARGGGHPAYWVGRHGLPNREWSKGSSDYAAFAAGRDDYREQGPIRKVA